MDEIKEDECKYFCNLCGGDTLEAFSARDYRRPLDKTEYSLRWCEKCSLGRIAGNFSYADVSKFYDIAYYTHGPADTRDQARTSLLDRVSVHLAWRADRGVDLTPAELGRSADRTLCEIGCGAGENLKCFAEAGFRVIGVEADSIARARASRFAQVFDGTAEALPHEILSQRFDVVLLFHVLEHCNDMRKSVANVRSIVARKGAVVVEVPNSDAKGFCIFRAEWPWADIPRHLNFFTEKSLRRTLEVGGFSVNRVQYVGYTRQFLPDWKMAQDAICKKIGTNESHRRIPSCLWLLQTAFEAAAKKYDSIRMLATPI
jgi:2-polyprenyl-3-methyl-5-hydroxy-6-metoxy-1,4-benzoquinol methylase